ncbi:bifunctional DNA primase/polymerase [Methylobacterium nodulans]|uniref:DNA primase/polymerase bifunctional N-terminal domain-containing protein n=1 Tax=Methylobacterium nodulans (strain LMG 21967 / CNCM I-2342 / ORS 2060) TaxID=460265 RepID=B8IY58_METNO|nr:bifunctional DNA primase/polymerase [Methylobacterium nodulans]ACL63348.1 hypothetical protein Mnod_7757 [Methylobacterium nodulans ORS 2060]
MSAQSLQHRAEPCKSDHPWQDYGHTVRKHGWRAIYLEHGEKGPKYADWNKRSVPTAADVERWQRSGLPGQRPNMGFNLGPQPGLPEGEHVVAVDADVFTPAAATAVNEILERRLPGAPHRLGNPAKVGTRFVRTKTADGSEPVRRQGRRFIFDGAPDTKENHNRVELLGQGQQSVVHGAHPCGALYTWPDGISIVELHPEALPLIPIDELNAIIAECDAAMEAVGGKVVSGATFSRSGRNGGGADLTPLVEADAEVLLSGLGSVRNDLSDRGDWVMFTKAFAALCVPALGEGRVVDALLGFTDRWEAAPETGDPDEILRIIREEEKPAHVGLREVFHAMRKGGAPLPSNFLARLDFARVPVNDNDMPRPELIQGPNIAETVDELERLIIKHKLPVFNRGGPTIVEKIESRGRSGEVNVRYAFTRLTPISAIDRVSRYVNVLSFDKKGNPYQAPLKDPVARAWTSRQQSELPTIGAIAQSPVLTRDGRIISKPGFDPETGVYIADTAADIELPADMAQWGSEPTARKAAGAALTLLKGLLVHYRFAGQAHLSVALAALLTPFTVHAGVRPPLFAVDATAPGSGKSKLVDTVSVIATGTCAPALNQGTSVHEFEKHFLGKVLEGAPILNIDNVEQPLEGDFLNTVLTQPRLSVRPLGTSNAATLEPRMMMFATGNNLVVRGDLVRRTLPCRIDPGVERPELEEYPFDPVERAAAARSELIGAALTILAAHARCGFPGVALLKGSPFGSFEAWSQMVRAALVWLGEPDPCDVMDALRAADPVRARLGAVLHAAAAVFEDGRAFHVRETIPGAAASEDWEGDGEPPRKALATALQEAIQEEKGGRPVSIDAALVGRYFGKHKDRVVDGLRIEVARISNGHGNLYRIARV